MLIFVCGPYSSASSAAEEDNVSRALRAATILLSRGHEPFVPHLARYWHNTALANGIFVPYERWMAYTLAWLACCDALLYLGPSPGADRELQEARKLGLPVYMDVDEVPGFR